jgi:hypothetical protein
LLQIASGILVALTLLAVLAAALEGGFRSGCRKYLTPANAEVSSQIGAIQGAILGLLGLLLAFSFAAAATRFMERQDQIVAEANAIGTAFLRADLLDEPQRSELRASLRDYTRRRVEVFGHLQFVMDPADAAEFARLQARIWQAARVGVAAVPSATLAVLNPVNEVIDLHTTRLAASRKHLPMPVLGLLVACSALALAVTGYACGIADRRRSPLSIALAILIGAALWITIDLDYPRIGLLQLDDTPLAELGFE